MIRKAKLRLNPKFMFQVKWVSQDLIGNTKKYTEECRSEMLGLVQGTGRMGISEQLPIQDCIGTWDLCLLNLGPMP